MMRAIGVDGAGVTRTMLSPQSLHDVVSENEPLETWNSTGSTVPDVVTYRVAGTVLPDDPLTCPMIGSTLWPPSVTTAPSLRGPRMVTLPKSDAIVTALLTAAYPPSVGASEIHLPAAAAGCLVGIWK